MHIQWDINMGALVGWALTIIGIVFAAGKISRSLEMLGTDLSELKSDFRRHQEEDIRRFDAIQQTLLNMVMKDNHK